MNGDTDNDVVIVEPASNNDSVLDENNSDKPLMSLFLRLIGNDSKQNTVLTNAQIIDILQKEFNMDIFYVHELEVDICLNILKKFLKDWPQWDEFDSAINNYKLKQDDKNIKLLLDSNYASLKQYLQDTLKSVMPLLRQTIEEVKQTSLKDNDVNENDIVMELQCTRQQLNRLFFRRPHPYMSNTIFNINSLTPSKIRIIPLEVEQMLNWPGVRININLNSAIVFKRDMCMNLKHVLVNKKLNYAEKPPEDLNTNLQMRGTKNYSVEIDHFITVLDEISKGIYASDDLIQVIRAVCNLIKSDLQHCPSQLYLAVYRRILSKTPLRRYLYTEVNTTTTFGSNQYDLQLEETGIPMFKFSLSRFQRNNEIPFNGNFIKIDCTICECKFDEVNILERMRQHFDELHQGEPDWHCPKCKRSYTMEYMTKIKWSHDCNDENTDLT